MKEHTHQNLRFSFRHLEHREKPTWLMDVHRVSDGHHVSPQFWLDHEPMDEEMVELAETWILAKAGNYEPEAHHCYACGATLESATGSDTDCQFDNALDIRFLGGYGMFVDPIDTKYEAVICHDCAHELCDKIPWIHKLIDPHRSHAHRTSYHEEHPDHYGWDYDRED